MLTLKVGSFRYSKPEKLALLRFYRFTINFIPEPAICCEPVDHIQARVHSQLPLILSLADSLQCFASRQPAAAAGGESRLGCDWWQLRKRTRTLRRRLSGLGGLTFTKVC